MPLPSHYARAVLIGASLARPERCSALCTAVLTEAVLAGGLRVPPPVGAVVAPVEQKEHTHWLPPRRLLPHDLLPV